MKKQNEFEFTDEEIKVMKDFIEKIKKEIAACPYPMKWFIATEIPGDNAYYYSNMCPVCAVEDMVNWIEETQMQHLSSHKEDEDDDNEIDKDEKIH